MWLKGFYGNVKEAITPNTLEPLEKDVNLHWWQWFKWKSNRAPENWIYTLYEHKWVSMKQATVETSVFDSEFIAFMHKQQWRLLCLVLSLLHSCMEKRWFEAFAVSLRLWQYLDQSHHIPMVIICVHDSQHSKVNVYNEEEEFDLLLFFWESVAMWESLKTHISAHVNIANIKT